MIGIFTRIRVLPVLIITAVLWTALPAQASEGETLQASTVHVEAYTAEGEQADVSVTVISAPVIDIVRIQTLRHLLGALKELLALLEQQKNMLDDR